jgi:hypothetical protein
MAWDLMSGIFKYIICKPTGKIYGVLVGSMVRRLYKTKTARNNSTCPNPRDIFNVSVENTKKKNIYGNIRNHLRASARGPTLFIVKPSNATTTRQQQDLLDMLMKESKIPRKRGATRYQTTEEQLLKANLPVRSLTPPYVVVYTPTGNVLHASANPANVRNFLKKNAKNFGLTVNNLRTIQKKNHPNKSLRDVLNMKYAALKRTAKSTKNKNLNLAYKRIATQLA